jgi:competence ComEA-like helix-hairpin-helix protein
MPGIEERFRVSRRALVNLLYRVQDRLTITRAESIAAVVLLSLYTIGMAIGYVIRAYPRYGDAFYADADSTFFALAGGVQGDESPTVVDFQHRDTTRTDSLKNGPGATDAENPLQVSTSSRIDLNRATATELTALPGVGPTIAGRIIAFRQRIGRFGSVEQLMEVRGIGPKKLAAIRDLVVVES